METITPDFICYNFKLFFIPNHVNGKGEESTNPKNQVCYFVLNIMMEIRRNAAKCNDLFTPNYKLFIFVITNVSRKDKWPFFLFLHVNFIITNRLFNQFRTLLILHFLVSKIAKMLSRYFS